MIQIVKYSLFKENKFPQSFHDEQITSTEIFLLGKVFLIILCVGGCHSEIILRCLSSFVVLRQKLLKRGLFLWIYTTCWFQWQIVLSSKRRIFRFSWSADDRRNNVFCARNPEMIVRCQSSSAVFRSDKARTLSQKSQNEWSQMCFECECRTNRYSEISNT